MKHLISSVLAVTALSVAPGQQTFTGIISDEMCATGSHAKMQMGATDAECTIACVNAHGTAYVLRDGDNVYALSDQQTPEKLAARRVRVVGTLDVKTKTIQVDSIVALSDAKASAQLKPHIKKIAVAPR